jgi:CubicO group peptidase (beta-lactamase class C family)
MTASEVSCAIIDRGELVGNTANEALVVPWWSFTKTVLAIATLALVRNGIIALDQAVEGEPYTPRQLLQHTAGLGDYGGLPEYHAAVERREDPWSVAELLHRSRAGELRYPPGKGWQYSNIGYLKVRQLIERATRMPLDAALDHTVFEPLRISGVSLVRERADLRPVAMGDADGYHPGWVYHGLLVGPLHAAARLLDRLFSSSLLPLELIDEMRAAYSVGPRIQGRPHSAPGYGLGLMIDMIGRDGALGHTGGGPGTTIAVYRRERGGTPITIAAFACCEDPGLVERVAFGLR